MIEVDPTLGRDIGIVISFFSAESKSRSDRILRLSRHDTVRQLSSMARQRGRLPFGNTQINDVVGRFGGPSTLAEGQVTVTVHSGNGRIGAVLSVVDNTSQDPTGFPLVSR